MPQIMYKLKKKIIITTTTRTQSFNQWLISYEINVGTYCMQWQFFAKTSQELGFININIIIIDCAIIYPNVQLKELKVLSYL